MTRVPPPHKVGEDDKVEGRLMQKMTCSEAIHGRRFIFEGPGGGGLKSVWGGVIIHPPLFNSIHLFSVVRTLCHTVVYHYNVLSIISQGAAGFINQKNKGGPLNPPGVHAWLRHWQAQIDQEKILYLCKGFLGGDLQ
jgi:hypothetical protein